jgi:hypothetical protein
VRYSALGFTVVQFAMRVLNRSFKMPAQQRNVEYYEPFHVRCILIERADITYKQALSLESYDRKLVRPSRGDVAKCCAEKPKRDQNPACISFAQRIIGIPVAR